MDGPLSVCHCHCHCRVEGAFGRQLELGLWCAMARSCPSDLRSGQCLPYWAGVEARDGTAGAKLHGADAPVSHETTLNEQHIKESADRINRCGWVGQSRGHLDETPVVSFMKSRACSTLASGAQVRSMITSTLCIWRFATGAGFCWVSSSSELIHRFRGPRFGRASGQSYFSCVCHRGRVGVSPFVRSLAAHVPRESLAAVVGMSTELAGDKMLVVAVM